MGITETSYKKLMKFSRDKFSGNESIYSAVSIFDSGDLLHSYFASRKFVDSDDIEELIVNFKDFISEAIRNGKRRMDAGKIINEADNFAVDNFGENYKDSDIIDGYIYRNSALYQRASTDLCDFSYRDERGNIDYDYMVEDMQKVMGEADRMYIAYNKNKKRQYYVGNPMAIPIESMYAVGHFKGSKEGLVSDGMG